MWNVFFGDGRASGRRSADESRFSGAMIVNKCSLLKIINNRINYVITLIIYFLHCHPATHFHTVQREALTCFSPSLLSFGRISSGYHVAAGFATVCMCVMVSLRFIFIVPLQKLCACHVLHRMTSCQAP